MTNWLIKESKYILKHKYMTVRKDVCETAEGIVIDPYFVLEFPTWVQVLAFNSDDKILVTRQYRHGVREVIYGLPTGYTEAEDISDEESIKRELLEETGYTSEKFISIGKLQPNPATQNNIVHCFAAFDIKKIQEPANDPSERITTEFVSVKDLLKLISDGEFAHALHVAGVFLTLSKLELLKLKSER